MRVLIVSLMFLCAGCRSQPQASSMPNTSITEVFALLIQTLGSPQVSIPDRYLAKEMLGQCKDERLIPLLVNATTDHRVFDPEAEYPSGSGEDKTHVRLVRSVCIDLLRARLIRNPRSQYEVRDWKEWWQTYGHLPLEEIRQMIESQGRQR